MSRVGKKPVVLPDGVKFSIDGTLVKVEGAKGKLEQRISPFVAVKQEGKEVIVEPTSKSVQAMADYGTSRALINNMVEGVSKGFSRGLELQGVGFVAQVAGRTLVLKTGYSHEVRMEIPEGVNVTVEKNTSISVTSADKHQLGDFAANIRKVCPPEPYLGKGIRYTNEKVRRKAGKVGGK